MSALIVRGGYYCLSVILEWIGKMFSFTGLVFHLASLWMLIFAVRIKN